MAHTVELLALMEEFPDAFQVPDLNQLEPGQSASGQSKTDDADPLLALIEEFPSAFLPLEQDEVGAENKSSKSDAQTEAKIDSALSQSVPNVLVPMVPDGYEMALHKQVSTFTWGSIDVFLRYGKNGLASLWITVGKSGTEIQSLCEAIARLVNLLLSKNVSTLEIIKEIRGIRGGDSEGLGPHRFLGLADLIGKILQDAPPSISISIAQEAGASNVSSASLVDVDVKTVETKNANLQTTTAIVSADKGTGSSGGNTAWLDLSDQVSSASVCPDCGAELQQVNGCSGGACVVCGFSSCS